MSNYIYLMDQLEGEYKKAFDKIYIYTGVRNMEGETEQEMMMNLLDMMLTAQHEGKPVEKIIGSDIEKFCQAYFEGYDYKVRIKEQLPKYLNRIMWVIFVFEMLCICFNMGDEDFNLWRETTDVSGYLVGLMCGGAVLLINNVIFKPFIFKWKKNSAAIYDIVCFMVTMVLIIVFCVLGEDKEFNIPLLPILVISGAYILIYKIVQVRLRYKKYSTIWKRKEPFYESWLGSVKNNVKVQLPGELVKRYNNINKRRACRGKELMTPDEYTEKIRKENKQSDIFGIILVTFISLMVLGMVIDSMIHESIIDGIILGALLCIVEIPISSFFLKTTKYRKKLIAECEKQGITLIEYAEKQQKNIEKQ